MRAFKGGEPNPLNHDKMLGDNLAGTEEGTQIARLIETGDPAMLQKILDMDKNRGGTLLTDMGRAAVMARLKGMPVPKEVDPNNWGFGKGVFPSSGLGPQLPTNFLNGSR